MERLHESDTVEDFQHKGGDVMFSKKFQRKYALTDQGIRNTRKGAFWTVVVNLVVMGGVGILYLTMSSFMAELTETGHI